MFDSFYPRSKQLLLSVIVHASYEGKQQTIELLIL